MTYTSTNSTLVKAMHGGGTIGGCSEEYGKGCPGYSGSGALGINIWSIGGSGGSNGSPGHDSIIGYKGGLGTGIQVSGFVLQTYFLRYTIKQTNSMSILMSFSI